MLVNQMNDKCIILNNNQKFIITGQMVLELFNKLYIKEKISLKEYKELCKNTCRRFNFKESQ